MSKFVRKEQSANVLAMDNQMPLVGKCDTL